MAERKRARQNFRLIRDCFIILGIQVGQIYLHKVGQIY
ncbi:hypothetical protein DESHY_150116 [Desulforamulus hydrothermalis Lam5 = DSM 18033]|uniref:Uncharacterized protein n=1 Tax=Desulforamulus hydrothermalis Lam5 = DSM 18033 TaxID=1121428 RepID=K8E8P6_9FIRM|nr:hypothetical protein DESHY_10079 [Desulforamulus hydrothermalis Lam5 = DSM 18033]CCO07873.1 hypothetical protein DESHY_150116 [Desulforamulus hydrothermalis Lam5 = DSM 18033]